MARMHADFNRITKDENGDKIPIGRDGAWQIERYRPLGWLEPGKVVILHDGEILVKANLEFDESQGWWYGRPNWDTRRDMQAVADGLEEYRNLPADQRLAILSIELDSPIKAISGGLSLLKQILENGKDGIEELDVILILDRIIKSTEAVQQILSAICGKLNQDR